MNKKEIGNFLIGFKDAESSFPFGPEALVFKVMGKMFALVSQTEEKPRVTLKCDPIDAEVLVSQFDSITPGYYMNKRLWISITLSEELPKDMLSDLARKSYDLVVNKLTKINQAKLQNE